MDEAGQVYMRLGSLELPPPHAIPVWLALDREREVEEELGKGGRMVEVVCSSGGHMVGARVGLYPDLPLGTVTGLAVTRLALSRTSVWALALSGQVYRRTGLSSPDWVAHSWQAVSGWESDARAVDLRFHPRHSTLSLYKHKRSCQFALRRNIFTEF